MIPSIPRSQDLRPELPGPTQKQSCHGSKTTFCWEGVMTREVTYPGGGGIQRGLESYTKPHRFNIKAKWEQVQPCSKLSTTDSQGLESGIFPPAQQHEQN